MSANILEEIVAARKRTFERRFSPGTLAALEREISTGDKPRDFFGAISGESGWGIIAEIKAKSPSKGVLLQSVDPAHWAKLYDEAGASAISIVTEENYFNGDPGWIRVVKRTCSLPVLRKDFFTTPEEIVESRAFGADAVLLIAAILHPGKLAELVEKAFELGMEPLVEVHSVEEARIAIETKARVIGVNNRNLRDFSVSADTTRRLLPFLRGRCVVSESGLGSREELDALFRLGVKAFLIGEAFLTASNPPETVRQFVSFRRPGVK